MLLNLVILAGIVRVFTSMRRGTYGEAELERQLANRGFFYRFFGRWMRAITKEWQMYPVGVVFGLGFDTATEVALLATTALLASQHIPWYAILCLPILFTAGMTVSRRHVNRLISIQHIRSVPVAGADAVGAHHCPPLTGAKRRSGAAAKQMGGTWRDTSESAHITPIA